MSRGGARSVERLLGVPLPASVREVCFERHQPSGDLSVYVAWARLTMPRADAEELVRQLVMSPRGASPDTDFHLVSGWNVFSEARPDWFSIRAPGEHAAARALAATDRWWPTTLTVRC